MTRPIAAPWTILLLCGATLLPFLFTGTIGAIDLPNHLARYSIIVDHLEGTSSPFYTVKFDLVPNLGFDAVVLVISFATSLGTDMATHGMIAATVVGIPLAAMLLQRAYFGTTNFISLFGFLFSFNYVLIYGFVNYLFSLAFAFWFAAIWIGSRPQRIIKILLFNALTTWLFICHLFGLGIYALIVLGFEMVHLAETGSTIAARVRRFVSSGLQFILPFALLLLSPTAQGAGRITWSDVYRKAIAIYSILDVGQHAVALASFAFLAVALAALLLRGGLRIHRAGGVSLLLMGAAFLIMPFTLFGSGFADYRLPLPMAVLFFAAASAPAAAAGLVRALTAALVLVVCGRAAFMATEWRAAGQYYAALRSAFAASIPEHARVLSILAEEDADMRFARRPPIEHAPLFAIQTSRAFVPTIFAEEGKQIIQVRPEYRHLLHISPLVPLYAPPDRLSEDIVRQYDYVVIYARRPLRRSMPGFMTESPASLPPGVTLFSVDR